MDEHRLLTALSDPTRRRIFEMLAAGGPQPVGALAQHVPVSRPAVSQHLRVLAGAGLVRAKTSGTRRIYAADPAGLAALRDWVEAQWEPVLDRFEAAARERKRAMTTQPTIIPVIKRRTVPLAPADAFDLFTARMGEWWPLETHSVGQRDAAAVRFEGRAGGRIVEITRTGEEHSWADVLVWEPPHRLVLSWHPSREPAAASTLEVRFEAADRGTTLVLEHAGWEIFGREAGERMRASYDSGWDLVLARFETAAV